MKAIHIIPSVARESSGPSYSVVQLCEALRREGADVTLAALALGTVVAPPAFLKTFPFGVGPRRMGHSPAMKQWLRDKVATGTVDIIHNHGTWQMNAVYPGRLIRGSGVSLITSPRGAFSKWAMGSGSWVKRVFWPLLQRSAVAQTHCFHATAESEFADIRRLGFRQPVAIIPNGVDLPPLLPSSPRALRTLLFLGRIHPVKGLDVLLPAWGRVQGRHPGWQLVIAGTDDDHFGRSGHLAEMQRLAAELALERIEFVGETIGDEKARLFSDAELFVLPSYSENFGMAVAEALAAGTPAIVSKGAPWPGLREHGAGWWIDHGVDALAAALDQALGMSPEALGQMGGRARHWMAGELSWGTIGRKMAQTYEWVRGQRAPTPPWISLD